LSSMVSSYCNQTPYTGKQNFYCFHIFNLF
jgi:hypothetical protein